MDVLEALERKMFEDEQNGMAVAGLSAVSSTPGEAQPGPPPLQEQSSGQHSSDSSVAQVTSNTYTSNLFREALARAEEEAFVECSGRIMKNSYDCIQQSRGLSPVRSRDHHLS
jgi:hypothetical protein